MSIDNKNTQKSFFTACMASIKKFFKIHAIIPLLLLLSAGVFTVIALIFGVSGVQLKAYYYDNFSLIITFSVFSLVFIIAAGLIPILLKKIKIYKWLALVQDILLLTTVVFSGLCFLLTFSDSQTLMLMGDVWFSELARFKPVPVAIMNFRALSMLFYILTALILIIASFMNPHRIRKTDKARKVKTVAAKKIKVESEDTSTVSANNLLADAQAALAVNDEAAVLEKLAAIQAVLKHESSAPIEKTVNKKAPKAPAPHKKTKPGGKIKAELWRGIGLIFGVLLVISITLSSLLESHWGVIDQELGTQSFIIRSSDSETLYTEYLPDDEYLDDQGVGDPDKIIQETRDLNRRISAEGSVLLKNLPGGLPLAKKSKVTLLGMSAYKIYEGASHGPSVTTNPSQTISLISALEEVAQFEINPDAKNFYAGISWTQPQVPWQSGSPNKPFDPKEPSVSSLSKSKFSEYGDAAIIVIGRPGREGADYVSGQSGIAGGTSSGARNALSLTNNEKALITLATGSAFGKVIVLINSGNTMEIQSLEDNPAIDSILYIGHPGNFGTLGIADVLCGNENPSGKAYDLFASNTMSAPAMYNVGRNTYSNADIIKRDTWQFAGGFTDNGLKDYLMEVEGIYIGYRYYETRYYDWVMNQGNARSDAGRFDSTGSLWKYSDEVTYGFGYGLSYGSFTQTLNSVDIETRGEYSRMFAKASVTVKNTGSVSGKSSVQLYAQAPYTPYDKANGVEKSAIQLIAFDKTDLIAPGHSQTITVEADLQNLASYDGKGFKTWILDKGKHYFSIGNGAHDALNNILTKIGKKISDGMTYEGNSANVQEWDYQPPKSAIVDSTTFSISRTGKKVENQLQYSDWNDYSANSKVTHLSRLDWKLTWPKAYSAMPISAGLMSDHLSGKYIEIKTNENTSGVVFGAPGNMKFAHLSGASFDDTRWKSLIDQIKYEEALEYAFQSGHIFASIESINFLGSRYAIDGTGGPVTNLAAGTATAADAQNAPWAILTTNPKYNTAKNFRARVAASGTVMASAFSPKLAYAQGLQYGNTALFTGTTILWGPGSNIHRHQYSGRNLEYYSEDPVLTGILSMEVSAGALEKGLICTPKHFAFNDQEIGRAGIAPFMTEQRAREIDLRAFQIPFEGYKYNGKAMLGTMLSFSKLGGIECTAHKGLLTEILREEWGFNGYVVSDYKDDFDLAPQAFKAGMTGFIWNNRETDLVPAINKFPGYKDIELLESLKDIVHRELYVFANSNVMNFVNSTSETIWQMTWWRQVYISLIAVTGGILFISVALYAVFLVRNNVLKSKAALQTETA